MADERAKTRKTEEYTGHNITGITGNRYIKPEAKPIFQRLRGYLDPKYRPQTQMPLPSNLNDPYIDAKISPMTHGQVAAGGKPVVQQKSGGFSTEKTISFEMDGKHIVIPTIINGVSHTPEAAILIHNLGRILPLGIFKTEAEAVSFAEKRSRALNKAFTGSDALIKGESNPSNGRLISADDVRAQIDNNKDFKSIPVNGRDTELLSAVAKNGMNGDTSLAHVTPGEVVIPREVVRENPVLIDSISNQALALGINPSRIMVGKGNKNPRTGIEEFATSKTEVSTMGNQSAAVTESLRPRTAAEKLATSQTIVGTPGKNYTYALNAGQQRDAAVSGKANGFVSTGEIRNYIAGYNPATLTSTYKSGDAIIPRMSEEDIKYANKYADPLTSPTLDNAATVRAKQQAAATIATTTANPISTPKFTGLPSAPSYLDPLKLDVRKSSSDQTVAGQMQGLLDPNNPWIKQNVDQAMAAANRRGVLNSSIATEAGQQAAIAAALQIATPDAAAASKIADYNSSLKNQATMYNMDASNAFLSKGIDMDFKERELEAQVKNATASNLNQLTNNIILSALSPERKSDLLLSLGQKGLASAVLKEDGLISNVTGELIRSATRSAKGLPVSELRTTMENPSSAGDTPKGSKYYIFDDVTSGGVGGVGADGRIADRVGSGKFNVQIVYNGLNIAEKLGFTSSDLAEKWAMNQ